MVMDPKKRGLGRGLSALLGEEAPAAETAGASPRTLTVDQLRPGRYQPRRIMKDDRLSELAQSIRERGVLQPLLVRPDPERPGGYEIVAGERRWRAAQLAQVHEIPVVVRDLDDRTALEVALVENLQREDLSPLEEAEGYQRLKDEFDYTQEALAQVIGKSRSHVANMLRLLVLPESVKTLITDGVLTAGHARALINAPDPAGLAQTIAAKGLSVRQAERLAKGPSEGPARKASRPEKDPDTVALERDLSSILGLRVDIGYKDGAGTLTVHFRSLDQLDDILRRLNPDA